VDGGVRGRRLAATAIDAALLAAPWTALVGLLTYHGPWGGLVGGMGDAVVVVVGCLAADVMLLLLDFVIWLAAGRTVGMGLVGIAVVRGRPWLASLVVVSLTTILALGVGAAAVVAGSVDPQNPVLLVLLGAKVMDLAFLAGASGRTLVDRMSGLQVAAAPPPPRPRIGGGIAVDVVLGLALAAPLLLALTDLHDLAGAAVGAGAALGVLLVAQVITLAVSRRTIGMRVLG
jgi:hypothetical protein